MMKETDKETGSWPGVLSRKDFDMIIKLRLRREIEKRYAHEVQSLCRIPSFGLAPKSTSTLGEIDQGPLENVIKETQEKAPLLNSMIMIVGPSSRRTFSTSSAAYSRLVGMKIVAILVILCRSAHRNNSNYIPLLIAMYMYSAGARVDAITLLNHLGFSVSYDVL